MTQTQMKLNGCSLDYYKYTEKLDRFRKQLRIRTMRGKMPSPLVDYSDENDWYRRLVKENPIKADVGRVIDELESAKYGLNMRGVELGLRLDVHRCHIQRVKTYDIRKTRKKLIEAICTYVRPELLRKIVNNKPIPQIQRQLRLA